MTKIIFLDVDGVLNNPESGFGGFFLPGLPTYDKMDLKWDPLCVAELRALVKATGASIVISSFWRIEFDVEHFKHFFSVYGWHNAPVIDVTPDHLNQMNAQYSRFVSASSRANEIAEWLAKNKQCTEYVIIDDMSPHEFCVSSNLADNEVWQSLSPRYVQTDPGLGFTSENYHRCLEILAI